MLVDPGYPPFSPLLLDRNAKLISEFRYPAHSTSDGYAVVNITRSDPQANALFHEDWVQPVAGSLVHFIKITYCITAGLEFGVGEMEFDLDVQLVEEMADSVHVFADDSVSHSRSLATSDSLVSSGLSGI
jgi:hypothetical protein